MIPFEKAYEIVMGSVVRTGTEKIPFTDSAGRILAEDVTSDIDMPPFDKATMDGFACRRLEIHNELEVIETIAAGKKPEKRPGRNQCSRIMTGAPIPEGADCVIIKEETEELPSGRIRFTGTYNKDNISCKGEDVRTGDLLLGAWRKIKPQDIAIMASAGKTTVTVSRMPAVAVISSGDEIVEPQYIPGESQIRNSNSWQLIAQIERAGARGRYYGIARDDEDETLRLVNTAIEENDLVIITGGVSMGDFDFVPGVLEAAGVRLLFTRVAVQPGKPTTFGIHENAAVFGLPGNPVSSFMMFEMLVRPFISAMMNFNWQPEVQIFPLKEDFSRKSAERMALIPVIITSDGCVRPVNYHGSAHITALAEADGIITIPVGALELKGGTLLTFRKI